jgi:hypothetical protein
LNSNVKQQRFGNRREQSTCFKALASTDSKYV